MNNYKILTNFPKNNNSYTFVNSPKEIATTTFFNKSNFIKLILLLLLYFLYTSHFFTYKIKEQNIVENEEKYLDIQSALNYTFNSTYIKNEMGTYGLYNIYKVPQISLILTNFDILKIDEKKLTNGIRFITEQKYKNIEVIIYITNITKKEFKKFKEKYKNIFPRKTFKFIFRENENEVNYSDLINELKGRYSIFINDLNTLPFLNLEILFNNTKGKIDNYFNFKSVNNITFYLFRTSLLKDYVDQGKSFLNLNNIINYIHFTPYPNMNYIHISICPDNHFTQLTYVAMTSILSSKSVNTYICFYFIIPPYFQQKNIDFLETLYEDYTNFNTTYIKMDNRYNKAYTDHRITTTAYYRFSLGELLPNLTKVLYLDSDIIAYKDLSPFYNLNFNGKMILGQPTLDRRRHLRKNFKGYRINSGILLLNLVEMRKLKFEKKVINIINSGKKLSYHDQTIINNYFLQYVGVYPPEFHVRPLGNFDEVKIFNRLIGNAFDDDFLYFAHKYPTIRHFLGRYKPKNHNINNVEDWFYFARKSKYYNKRSKRFDDTFSF